MPLGGGSGITKVNQAQDVAFSGPVAGDIFTIQSVSSGNPTFTNRKLLKAVSRQFSDGNYTAAHGDFVLLNTTGGAITVTLPTAVNGGQVQIMKTDSSANPVTVIPASGTLNGVTAPSGTLTTTTQSGNYTASAGNYVLANASSAGFTVTLPLSASNGAWIRVMKTDSSVNGILVVPQSGTISGDASFVANRQYVGQNFVYNSGWQYVPDTTFVTYAQYTSQTFVSDGTTWYTV